MGRFHRSTPNIAPVACFSAVMVLPSEVRGAAAGHGNLMAQIQNDETATASETPGLGGIDHHTEIAQRRTAADEACKKHERTWAGIVTTLVDNRSYIQQTRATEGGIKQAADAAGVQVRGKAASKPVHFILRLIYPEKERQRISDWATALEIADKFGWPDKKLRSELIATPIKQFKKTHDPAPPKPKPKPKPDEDACKAAADTEKAARDDVIVSATIPDGALAVITMPDVGAYAGKVVCYGEVLGDGRIVITKWAQHRDDQTNSVRSNDPPAVQQTGTEASPGADDDASRPDMNGNEAQVVRLLAHIVKGLAKPSLQKAADGLNSRGITALRGGLWYPASVRALIMQFGYQKITDLIAGCPSNQPLGDGPDDDPPPAARASVPTAPITITVAGAAGLGSGGANPTTMVGHSDAVIEAAAAHHPSLVAILAVSETAKVMEVVDGVYCDAYRTEERFDGLRSGRNWPVMVEITAEAGTPALGIYIAGRPTAFAKSVLSGSASDDWDGGPSRPRATVSGLVFLNALQQLAAGPGVKIRERGVKGANSNIDTSNAPAITILASGEGISIVSATGHAVWMVNERLAAETGVPIPEPSYRWAAAAAA